MFVINVYIYDLNFCLLQLLFSIQSVYKKWYNIDITIFFWLKRVENRLQYEKNFNVHLLNFSNDRLLYELLSFSIRDRIVLTDFQR